MIGIIIQARTGSTRFPRKIYENIDGKTTIQRVLEGCNKSQMANKIILAMPEYDEKEYWDRQNNDIFPITNDIVDQYRYETFFGHADDLVDRYFKASRAYGLDLIVRVTGDCPLVQGDIIDQMLIEYLKNDYNGYIGSNFRVSTMPYPTGVHAEIFPYYMLAETNLLATGDHREHCATYMYRRGTQYNVYEFRNIHPNTTISTRFSDFSFDTKDDLKLIKEIVKEYDKHGNLNRAILNAKEPE